LLKLQIGLDLREPIELTDMLDKLLQNHDNNNILNEPFELQESVNFHLVQTQKELASLSLANEYVAFLPSIAAFGTIQQDAQRSEFNLFESREKWYPTTVVGVQMSWNLFSGSAKIFRIQKAKIALNQAENNLERAERGLWLQYDQAKSSLESSQKRFNNYRNNQALAKEIYETTLEKFHEGLSTSLELTQSYNQYLNAEAEYLRGISDMLTARTSLEKILGIL
jgi:outer membrane protein TolC